MGQMRTLKIKTDGSAVRFIKQLILIIALALVIVSTAIAISVGNISVAPETAQILRVIFISGSCILVVFGITMLLVSRDSPIQLLALRKRLILFNRMFLKTEQDGTIVHSVYWKYAIDGKKIIIDLYANGLVSDMAIVGQKLSEYLGKKLLDYHELDGKARYVFGQYSPRYDGVKLMSADVSSITGEYKPMISYDAIPIYDNVTWNINSEALHMLLIAPSGAGKTMLLNYLAGMILKRQHMLYIVDAKNSSFGALFRHIGVPVATNVEEIIQMLTALVNEMEEIYTKYFASGEAAIDANYSTLKIKGHFLIFDEILSVLDSAGKKEKAEIERLLGQLALKGRAAGFALIVSAQKLNATDLPKAITEQCQTRIVLGKMVSDETFHQVMGAYKKDLAHAYRGGVGMGYAVTPKTGLSYIETPLMPHNSRDYVLLLKELRDRGTPYGEGC